MAMKGREHGRELGASATAFIYVIKTQKSFKNKNK